MAAEVNGRHIGPGSPTHILAEISTYHHQDFDLGTKLVKAAKKAGTDKEKTQGEMRLLRS